MLRPTNGGSASFLSTKYVSAVRAFFDVADVDVVSLRTPTARLRMYNLPNEEALVG